LQGWPGFPGHDFVYATPRHCVEEPILNKSNPGKVSRRVGKADPPVRGNRLVSSHPLVRSELAGLSDAEARRILEGLPRAGEYEVIVKPLRYRTRPHLAARCEFEERRIVLQVPVPFRPFREPVIFAARRMRGPRMRFAWASETVSFRLRREVLRFLYCHEWMHWYLYEVMGRRSSAETACDRFALRNFRRLRVSTHDADVALKRRRVATG
jgi:hypothetical protein